MNHTISILVKNESGVLSRISGLFSARGFNIESLTVAPTVDTDYSRITIVTTGDDGVIEQINKQLNRLIPVIKVMDLKIGECLETELVLIKVGVKEVDRAEVLRIAEVTGAKIIDISTSCYTLQIVGDEKQVNTLIELLQPLGIKECVRSGKVAISRDNRVINIKSI